MYLEYFFPSFSPEVIKELESAKRSYLPMDGVNFSEKPTEECNILAPVDEVTGNRPNLLDKVVDEHTSPLEKERILSSLQRVPTSQNNRMSDSDLIATTPSRYNQTLVDNEKFANHLESFVDYVNTDSSEKDSPTDDSSVSDSGSDK